MSADKLDTLFDWVMDLVLPRNGLVAVAGDGGLAHFCAMPLPLKGAKVGFLNDLYVDPYRRADGTGEALLRRVDEIASTGGWGVVRWITRDKNNWAHRLYDRLSRRSDRITYEITAATTGREVK